MTALISPIAVHSQVLRKELPILTAVTALAAWQLSDGVITRADAALLLAVFAGLMAWTIWQGLRQQNDALGSEIEQELAAHAMPVRRAVFWLALGLILLIISSRILVWGAVEIAEGLGVSDLIIGLTVVAVGTSLPELASSIIAATAYPAMAPATAAMGPTPKAAPLIIICLTIKGALTSFRSYGSRVI